MVPLKRSTPILTVALMSALAALSRVAPAGDAPTPTPPDPQKTYAEGQAIQIGWPALAGPYGNFLPLRTDVPIVDDLSKVAVAWESENSDLGVAKQGTPFGKSFQSGEAIKRYLAPEAGRHPGNWAGVIVAEGKVFAASFRPTGPMFECDFPDKAVAKVRVDAEDFVVALDFNTGKTLWLSAEPGGMLVGGGKRQGFQVAPVYSGGRLFAMGSTGRLFAYEAASGKKLWQSDIGAAHRAAAAARTEVLASLAKRKFSYRQSPAWHTSLVVAEQTLVVPTFASGGLRGLDVQSGQVKWEARGVGSHLATPSIFCSAGRQYVLTANPAGEMRLLDPKDGTTLWEVTGLGPAYFTLAPSSSHVLVNVNAEAGKKRGEDSVPGYLGAYRISPEKAELAWKMPAEPRNGIACWMDSEARYQYTMQDGLAFFYTSGAEHRTVPGRFLIAREDTGEIVAEHLNEGSEADGISGLWYLLGHTIVCRSNNCHGPTHGGRHAWVLWSVAGNKIERLPGTLDRNEFTNGYEVNMQYPVVAGRMFERNEAGRVLCYDLRNWRPKATWRLNFRNGMIGAADVPVELVVGPNGQFRGGKSYPPGETAVGAPRLADVPKEAVIDVAAMKIDGATAAGQVRLNFGSFAWPTELRLQQSGRAVSGVWTRKVAALDETLRRSGTVTGEISTSERVWPAPTPNAERSVFGPLPAGRTNVFLVLDDANPTARTGPISIRLEHDGNKVTQAAVRMPHASKSWGEIDASALRLQNGRITGDAVLVCNRDIFFSPNSRAGTGVAGKLTLDVTIDSQSGLSGTHEIVWGVPWEFRGTVEGAIRKCD